MKETQNLDLSKYEEIGKQEDLIIYRYSKNERKSNYLLVHQYFYDRFVLNDYNFCIYTFICGKNRRWNINSNKFIF